MIFKKPQTYAVLSKKYPSKPAIELHGKVVHVGPIKTQREYRSVMKALMERYPKAKEEEFVYSFIFGRHPYII